MTTKTTKTTTLPVILGTADRTEAVHTAIAYVTNDQGWTRCTVTGLLQDPYDNYIVRLAVERGRNAAVVAVQLEWNGHVFEVTEDAITEADYDARATTPVMCAYCGRQTTQDHLVQHVCRTCHRNGIEA